LLMRKDEAKKKNKWKKKGGGPDRLGNKFPASQNTQVSELFQEEGLQRMKDDPLTLLET